MKSANIILTVALTLGSSSLFAQTGAASGTKFGMGEDSIRCIQNISLYEPYAKQRNFKDAVDYWEIAFNECPAASKNLYIYGVNIVKWQLSQEKDPAKLAALKEKLMRVYDQRIKYFGNDRQYPTERILGNKGVDYVNIYGKDANLDLAYEMLNTSVENRQGESSPEVIKSWVEVSERMFKANPDLREQYINNYLKSLEYLDYYLANFAKDKMIEYTENVKTYATEMYAKSGAADCEALEGVFGPKIEENKDNVAFLKQTIALLRRSKCQESDAYFKASEYAHKIEPTSESALGMAKQAMKKDDYDQALIFLEETASLSTANDEKADAYLAMASIYNKRKSFPKAREFARKSLQADPNQSTPYILIANMYANSGSSIYPNDPIMAQAVFYAAVDQLEKAKQAEPAKATEINSLISSYRSHFPSNENVFMHPELKKGESVTIGGWIQEKTVVR